MLTTHAQMTIWWTAEICFTLQHVSIETQLGINQDAPPQQQEADRGGRESEGKDDTEIDDTEIAEEPEAEQKDGMLVYRKCCWSYAM